MTIIMTINIPFNMTHIIYTIINWAVNSYPLRLPIIYLPSISSSIFFLLQTYILSLLLLLLTLSLLLLLSTPIYSPICSSPSISTLLQLSISLSHPLKRKMTQILLSHSQPSSIEYISDFQNRSEESHIPYFQANICANNLFQIYDPHSEFEGKNLVWRLVMIE